MLGGGKCRGEKSSREGEQEIWGRSVVLKEAVSLLGFCLKPKRKSIGGLEEGGDVI